MQCFLPKSKSFFFLVYCSIMVRWKYSILMWTLTSLTQFCACFDYWHFKVLDICFSFRCKIVWLRNGSFAYPIMKRYYTRVGNVCPGWPIYGVKCLCSRGPEWKRVGSHSHKHFNIWFLWYETLWFEFGHYIFTGCKMPRLWN